MKLVAINTIQGSKFYPKDDKKPHSKERHESVTLSPGQEFDTDDIDIDEDEAKRLIDLGVAREKGKLEDKPVQAVPMAENTAALGPASGATKAPDPAAVAKVAVTKA